MKSIKARLLSLIITMVALLCITTNALSIVTSFTSIDKTLKNTLPQTASGIANAVGQYLKLRTIEIEGIAGILSVSKDSSSAQMSAMLNEYTTEYGANNIGFVDTTGKGVSSKGAADISSRDYFKQALAGESVISKPVISNQDKSIITVYAAPVKSNGTIIGVAYLSDNANRVVDMLNSVSFGTTGNAYILDEAGLFMFHGDDSLVVAEKSFMDMAATDKNYAQLGAVTQEIIANPNGIVEYELDNVKYISAYAPIEDTTWSLVANAPRKDFMGPLISGTVASIGINVALVIISIIITFVMSKRIAEPITVISKRILLLSEGDLSSEVVVFDRKDEIGILSQSLKKTIDNLQNTLGEISNNLTKMAANDLRVELKHKYFGDFISMKTSMERIVVSLNSSMHTFSSASQQVDAGAAQVAQGAQALSDGANQQTFAIESLSSTVAGVSELIKETAQHAEVVNDITTKTAVGVNEGNDRMQDMIVAMNDISVTSAQIGKIIKTIDDIAFQTNILALNAAVEAARAGVAGKGFAVVADEVRNLAAKSAKAAKDTTELIESSIIAVENGRVIADNTAKSLEAVVSGVHESAELIHQITVASLSQSIAMKDIIGGIDMIAAITQSNSATAEQSAAASEELSGQSAMLREQIDLYKLI